MRQGPRDQADRRLGAPGKPPGEGLVYLGGDLRPHHAEVELDRAVKPAARLLEQARQVVEDALDLTHRLALADDRPLAIHRQQLGSVDQGATIDDDRPGGAGGSIWIDVLRPLARPAGRPGRKESQPQTGQRSARAHGDSPAWFQVGQAPRASHPTDTRYRTDL